MRVHRWTGASNFGDVLNDDIWPRVLTADLGVDDGTVLLGIGTLIGLRTPPARQIIVFGSGAGYGSIGSVRTDARYRFDFVRGPLTAEVLGLSVDRAITDPAILVATLSPPRCDGGGVAFMPHWRSALRPWGPRLCHLAGLTWIDPLAPTEDVIQSIAGSRLVLTEAMHGAIVADALRVPWKPVFTTRSVSRFKWLDWLLSLEMAVPFHYLRPFGMVDLVRNSLPAAPIEQALLAATAMGGRLDLPQSVGDPGDRRLWLRKVVNRLPLLSTGRRVDRWLGHIPGYLDPIAAALARLGTGDGMLSDEGVFVERLNRVQEQVGRLNAEYAS